MSDRQMCRTCFCLGYDLVPVNGEWSCMEHLNGRDAAAEIVRLNEQLAERTLQHQVQLDNAVDLTARLAAAEAERDALAGTCVEAADQIDTLRGLLREAVDMPRYSTRFENWRGRVTAALEGKP